MQGRIAGAVAIILPILIILYGTRPAAVPKARDLTVFIESPSPTELLDDSTAIDHLKRAGVKGMLLKPSTLEGLLEGKEATMASGAEILRLFRMESVANIWMWEQIKDKPIRPEATYVFTNQLLLFETFLEALSEQLGRENVRPYKDQHHDFGGEVPSNYIIEVLATPDELRSVALGLDKSYREKMNASGLIGLMKLSTEADVAALPAKTPAIFVADTAAAAAAYAALDPASVFLAPGIPNPGWSKAVVAHRLTPADSAPKSGEAVIVAAADVLKIIARFKNEGFMIGESDSAPEMDASPPWTVWPARVILFAGAFWFLLDLFAFLKYRTTIIAISLVAAAAFSSVGYPEIFGAILLITFTIQIVRDLERPAEERKLWETGIVIMLLLLAGELTAVGRGPLEVWRYSLVAVIVYAILYSHAAAGNALIVAVVALAASSLLSTSPLFFGGALLGWALLAAFGRDAQQKRAAALLVIPAALSFLLHRGEPLLLRSLFAAWSALCLVAPLLKKRYNFSPGGL